MGLKWTEILLILFALMLLFGASRLPQLGSSLGSAIRNFKKGFTGDGSDDKAEDDKKLAQGAGDGSIASSDKAASKQS
ncbi:MAG: twin-arginine translocase TatA/TatE family subunit [Archangium gephyra]|uniref:Sec-independent protein translocase protein TatA n=1 Tax=Archangium gephyra TaxID=48 RepID=A0A2W5TE94_9BACT|nr:MAG: twin-arginine translocase TatA/TatE family subunit [Archangium gephyra]